MRKAIGDSGTPRRCSLAALDASDSASNIRPCERAKLSGAQTGLDTETERSADARRYRSRYFASAETRSQLNVATAPAVYVRTRNLGRDIPEYVAKLRALLILHKAITRGRSLRASYTVQRIRRQPSPFFARGR
jgi:hypothetical protein